MITPLALTRRALIAEPQMSLTPSFFGRETAREVRVFFMPDVGFDLFGEVLICVFLSAITADGSASAFGYSGNSPRMSPMARVILRQRSVAALSSLRPLFVRR